jgi:hypothetical protein
MNNQHSRERKPAYMNNPSTSPQNEKEGVIQFQISKLSAKENIEE